jgi:hypothetical protein
MLPPSRYVREYELTCACVDSTNQKRQMDKLSTSPKSTPRFESQLTAHLKPFASGEVRPRLSAKEWHQVHDEELESVSLEYTGIHIHNIIRNPRYLASLARPAPRRPACNHFFLYIFNQSIISK